MTKENIRELLQAGNFFCYLVNPANPTATIESGEALKAAAMLGLRVEILKASTEVELEAAFSAAASFCPLNENDRRAAISAASRLRV